MNAATNDGERRYDHAAVEGHPTEAGVTPGEASRVGSTDEVGGARSTAATDQGPLGEPDGAGIGRDSGESYAARTKPKTTAGSPSGFAATTPVPVRTLQPGDVTQEGLTVLRVTPEVGSRLHVRFEDDDTLWRMHRDSIVWVRRPERPCTTCGGRGDCLGLRCPSCQGVGTVPDE